MSERAVFNFVVRDVDAGVDAHEMVAYAHSQQRQILEHWTQYWEGLGLVRSATAQAPEAGDVEILLMNKPTLDGALGYHDRKEDGTPIAYIFVGLARELGEDWTSIASHEVLEILGDPDLALTVQMHDGFWDREVCDRVEADSYVIDGVKLSNFNTPAAFSPPDHAAKSLKYDHLGLSKHPNEVRAGGYAQRFDADKGWVQVGTASAYRTKLRELGLSRGARRAAAEAEFASGTPSADTDSSWDASAAPATTPTASE